MEAKRSDGSLAVQFGGPRQDFPNCLLIMPRLEQLVPLYRPRPEVRTAGASWKLPGALPRAIERT
jgi:hypothetical protein